MQKFSNSKRLKIKRKRTKKLKTRESVIQLKYALGDDYVNLDSSHQFFDQGSVVKELPVLVHTNHIDVIDAFNHSDIILPENKIDSTNLSLKRIKIYSRPFYLVSHELLMICAFDDASKHEYYFVIDRGAKEYFKTKVRIIYTGKLTKEERQQDNLEICDSGSNQWAEIRGISNGQQDSTLLGEHPEENLKVASLPVLIDSVVHYAFRYPDYNLISTNCQHFATGFFNAYSKDDVQKKPISNPYLSFRCNRDVSHVDLLDEILITSHRG